MIWVLLSVMVYHILWVICIFPLDSCMSNSYKAVCCNGNATFLIDKALNFGTCFIVSMTMLNHQRHNKQYYIIDNV